MVEDHDAHASLVEVVWEEMKIPVRLYRVVDVDEALSFQTRCGTL
jgi:hypothetical protein